MPLTLPRLVADHLAKCHAAAVAAVEAYNRPGRRFRTAQYLVLITISWTALFHAIFYRRGIRPWYRKPSSGSGRGIRYIKDDGEPKHWDLAKCLKRFYGGDHPPERKNLEFILGLRNKIEHRHLPELDASLYGECQAALLNLEEFVSSEFGEKYALTDQLAVSLQFSRIIPDEKRKAAKTLAGTTAKGVRDYIERFRGNLPSSVLNSMKYSFNVFLVPKVANREKTADVVVEFVRVNEASPEELDRLEKLNVLIREKHIPIANVDLHRPSDVKKMVQKRVHYRFTMANHTDAWKHFRVRPAYGDPSPRITNSDFCVYDEAHGDYLYTNAWVEKLVREFSDPRKYKTISGREPVSRGILSSKRVQRTPAAPLVTQNVM